MRCRGFFLTLPCRVDCPQFSAPGDNRVLMVPCRSPGAPFPADYIAISPELAASVSSSPPPSAPFEALYRWEAVRHAVRRVRRTRSPAAAGGAGRRCGSRLAGRGCLWRMAAESGRLHAGAALLPWCSVPQQILNNMVQLMASHYFARDLARRQPKPQSPDRLAGNQLSGRIPLRTLRNPPADENGSSGSRTSSVPGDRPRASAWIPASSRLIGAHTHVCRSAPRCRGSGALAATRIHCVPFGEYCSANGCRGCGSSPPTTSTYSVTPRPNETGLLLESGPSIAFVSPFATRTPTPKCPTLWRRRRRGRRRISCSTPPTTAGSTAPANTTRAGDLPFPRR